MAGSKIYSGQLSGKGIPRHRYPYNKDLISLNEIAGMGEEICGFDPKVQVCVLDYRPEFRSHISRPTYNEMKIVHQILKETGLKTVVCQTIFGHIGP